MLQRNSKTNSFWTPDEIEELQRSLQVGDVAEVDTDLFGKRLSEIILRGRDTKTADRALRQNKAGRNNLLIEA